MKTLHLTDEDNQFLLDRRIECDGYPGSEAYCTVVDYIKHLEKLIPCTKGFGEGSCPDCDCGS